MRSAALIAVACVAWTVVALAPRPAEACGGFFCDAQNRIPVLQAEENVLFAKHGDRTTMHVQVSYDAEAPTNFGWILPLPEQPTDVDGEPLPLDQTVQISSSLIFEILEERTKPRFRVDKRYGDSYCEPSRAPAVDAGVRAGDVAGGEFADRAPVFPGVEVLEEARVGPYDAQLVQADDTDQLLQWLNFNGYFQDPAARPILEDYVLRDYLFVGIRLSNGNTADDMKPLALTFGEDAPCLPLRLTAIAAVDDMPLRTWVLGSARAIPKNFIHARVNDRAIAFPGGANYEEVVTSAVDTVEGRAWVTESSGPAADHRGAFLSEGARDTSGLEAAETLAGAIEAMDAVGIPRGEDFEQIVRDAVPMPEGLMGYPHGNCWYDADRTDDACPDSNDAHATTEEEFYGFIGYWAERAAAGEIALEADLDAVKARVEAEIVAPLAGVEDLLAKTEILTRFFTTVSPEEMTRDPLFAFNPDLPPVDRDRTVVATVEADGACNQYVIAEYPDGSTVELDCPSGRCPAELTLPAVEGAAPLRAAEVLDESGEPIPFDPLQSSEVDQLLGAAVPGSPSLPEGFEPEPPPNTPPNAEAPSEELAEAQVTSGCAGASPWSSGWVALVGLLAGLALSRRRAGLA